MALTRRPIGDVLYSLYLVALVVGVVAVAAIDDVGEFGGATDSSRAALGVAAAAGCLLTVASSVRGRLPLLVDLPTLFHVGRRSRPLGLSLRGLLAARFFLSGAAGSIVAFALSRPLVLSATAAAGLALVVAVLAWTLTALSIAVQARRPVARWAAAALLAVMTIALIALLSGVDQAIVLLTAVLVALASTLLAGITLESVPFQRLAARAEVLYELVPRLYLLTPSDLHLAIRLSPSTGYSRRVPIDGRLGLARLAVLAAVAACIFAAAPSPSYGYPVAAGVVAYFVGLDLVTPLRIESVLWDRIPTTFPRRHLAAAAAKAMAAGMLLAVVGLAVTAAPRMQTVGLTGAALGLGSISVVPSALARELRFAELLLDHGPQALGLAIAVRMSGGVVLAALGAVGAHLWVGEGTALGLAAVAAVAAVAGVSAAIMVVRR